MKKYLLLILVAYILIMLIPVPILFKSNSDDVLGANNTTTSQTGTSSTGTLASTSPTTANSAIDVPDSTFKMLDVDTGVVIDLSARDLLIGCVSAEMYATYHEDALKAQTVACYTYYLVLQAKQKEKPDEALKGADFYNKQNGFSLYYSNDQLKERWGENYNIYYEKISSSVDSVLGYKITLDGKPINALFHSISSGITEDAVFVWGAEYSYLKAVSSEGDKLSPDYEKQVSFTTAEFKEKMKTIASDLVFPEDEKSFVNPDFERSPSDTVLKITICGKDFTGKQIREAFALSSSAFDVSINDGKVLFATKGYGHGVGMSQYGADYMARQGTTWREILNHYYTNVEITS